MRIVCSFSQPAGQEQAGQGETGSQIAPMTRRMGHARVMLG
jgi:hypothetical protein